MHYLLDFLLNYADIHYITGCYVNAWRQNKEIIGLSCYKHGKFFCIIMGSSQMVKVSVIIPVYNEEKYLPQCLDSLCTQTLHDIEIICVDDGSTDNSLSILEEYSKKDLRIKVLKQKNQYAGVARNTGMAYAIGKYLSFLDADDFFGENFLEKMYIAAEKNQADITICRVNHFNNQSKIVSPRDVEEELIYLPENKNSFSSIDIPDYIFQISNGWAWDKLFRADFIKKLGIKFQEYRIANDGFFVYAALAQANVIAKIDDFLVIQRVNNEQSLSNTRESTWYCGFEMLYAIQDYLQQNALYNMLKQSFHNFCMKYVIWSMESMKSLKVKSHIYDAIKDELFVRLEMNELTEDYFYDKNRYDKYQFISIHTYDEYLSMLFEEKERSIGSLNRSLTAMRQKLNKKVWMFPYSQIEKGSNIVLYGAGEVGRDYYQQICDSGYCDVVLWMDKRFTDGEKDNAICGWTDELEACNYDKILIAVRNENAVQEILSFLIKENVPEDKLVYVNQ